MKSIRYVINISDWHNYAKGYASCQTIDDALLKMREGILIMGEGDEMRMFKVVEEI